MEGMEDFRLELQGLDDTQERVEAVSDELLRAIRAGSDGAVVEAMVEEWIEALRASGFQSERIAFLYVANHVLQKTLYDDNRDNSEETPRIVGFFGRHMEEAVSLVSNSPMDRQSVARLLELWHENGIFTDVEILKMWKSTGEDIPSWFAEVAGSSDSSAGETHGQPTADSVGDVEAELQQAPPPALPKLNAHAANPVLNVLKKIDRHKAAIQHLEQVIRKTHQFILTEGPTRYASPENLLSDYTTTIPAMKQRVEECLRLVKTRNRYMEEIPALKEELKTAIASMIAAEEASAAKNDQRLEQCDLIDIGLADLAEHKETYPDEWSTEASASMERRRRREEEQREREYEMARLHQAALAESAAHAMNLEADITGESRSELRSLAKGMDNAQRERDQKPEQSNEMVWHPVLRELVPLQSLNVEWEDWRDH